VDPAGAERVKPGLHCALRSAIEFDPIARDLAERIAEQVKVDGFLDVAVASEIVGRNEICGFARGGPKDDWN